MAELIQKKLQGEVEKYQQLQKGKRAERCGQAPSGASLTSRLSRTVSNQVFPLTTPDLSKSMSGRQTLEAQLTENNIVKEVRMGRWVRGGTSQGAGVSHSVPSSGTGLAGWLQRGL